MAPSLSSAAAARHAYVSFLAGAGDYIKGTIALAKSLRRVNSAYQLIVAVLDDVPEEHRELLRLHGCLVRPIQHIHLAGSDGFCFANPHYVINYSKLAIWLFEDFEKMIYLDADIVVYDNIDHLLELPHGQFYAVLDCFCEPAWSQSLQYKVKYCQQCPDRNPWPRSLGLPPPKYFNAGMFVFEPSKDIFDEMMVALLSTPPTPFAEQDFLNTFFNKIFSPIPLIYNLITPMLWRHPENVDLKKVKVVHYCAQDSKPWRCTGKEEYMEAEKMKMLVEKWWNIYDDKPLDYPYLRGSYQVQQQLMSSYPSPHASLTSAKNASLMSAKNAMDVSSSSCVDAC